MDLDGVLTDGSIIYGNNGEILKVFSVYDGYGINRGRKLGLKFGIISGRKAKAVKHRAERLKIDELYQNCDNKIKAYNKIKKKYKLSDENFCFVGDEMVDLELLKITAFSCAPANAIPEIKEIAHFVTKTEGGKGAVREVIDLILKKKGLI